MVDFQQKSGSSALSGGLSLGRMASLVLVCLALVSGQGFAQEGASVPEATAVAKSAGDAGVALERIIETPLSVRESRERAQRAVNELSREIQGLKQNVVALNKDLRVLEEDLLFPANTRFHVFVSLNVGEYFRLEGVELRLDNDVVTSYLYSGEERQALAKGGKHQLYLGNLSPGKHTLSAFFVGQGPNGREYKRGSSLKFTKSQGPKFVELAVADSEARQQPEFSVREW